VKFGQFIISKSLKLFPHRYQI